MSRIGMALKKYSAKPGVSSTNARQASMLAADSPAAASRKRRVTGLAEGSSVAATSISGLRRPISVFA